MTGRAASSSGHQQRGRLAAPILAASELARNLHESARRPYLATPLAGQNSPIDLRGHGQERRRLQSRVGTARPLHTLSIGELAAMSWLAESWTQREAVKRFAGSVIALDFEAFLSNVADSIAGFLATRVAR
jgi:hypothetical protein